jgi:hypothetical protein
MAINCVENEDGSFTISWDENDPVESMLNDWTEKDFIDCLMQRCDEILEKESYGGTD